MSQAALQAALRAAFVAEGIVADPSAVSPDPASVDPLMAALAAAIWPYVSMTASTGVYLTPEGGLAVPMVNGTGVASVKGTVVEAGSTSGQFIASAGENDAIGVVYESGIAALGACWVVISGIAEVLYRDGETPTSGYWVYATTTAGRAANLIEPPGGAIAALDNHFKEIGHCIQLKASGTDVLAKCVLHFN